MEIIITDPTLPEYRIVNQTDHVIHFAQMKEIPFWQKQETIESMLIKGRFMAVDPHSDIPYTWESRVPTKRLFGIKVGQSLQEISIEKVMKPAEVSDPDNLDFMYFIQV